jgi:hypothetical protein
MIYPTSFSPLATNNESYLNSRQFHNEPAEFAQLQFPRQPINITPSRNPPQQKIFTNNQVFGKPKNVFRPTGGQFLKIVKIFISYHITFISSVIIS